MFWPLFFDSIVSAFKKHHSLTELDKYILVKSRRTIEQVFGNEMLKLWDAQRAVNSGVKHLVQETMFYPLNINEAELGLLEKRYSFPNKTPSLDIIGVHMYNTVLDLSLIANVGCVSGFLFNIEFNKNQKEFEYFFNPNVVQLECFVLADISKKVESN